MESRLGSAGASSSTIGGGTVNGSTITATDRAHLEAAAQALSSAKSEPTPPPSPPPPPLPPPTPADLNQELLQARMDSAAPNQFVSSSHETLPRSPSVSSSNAQVVETATLKSAVSVGRELDFLLGIMRQAQEAVTAPTQDDPIMGLFDDITQSAAESAAEPAEEDVSAAPSPPAVQPYGPERPPARKPRQQQRGASRAGYVHTADDGDSARAPEEPARDQLAARVEALLSASPELPLEDEEGAFEAAAAAFEAIQRARGEGDEGLPLAGEEGRSEIWPDSEGIEGASGTETAAAASPAFSDDALGGRGHDEEPKGDNGAQPSAIPWESQVIEAQFTDSAADAVDVDVAAQTLREGASAVSGEGQSFADLCWPSEGLPAADASDALRAPSSAFAAAAASPEDEARGRVLLEDLRSELTAEISRQREWRQQNMQQPGTQQPGMQQLPKQRRKRDQRRTPVQLPHNEERVSQQHAASPPQPPLLPPGESPCLALDRALHAALPHLGSLSPSALAELAGGLLEVATIMPRKNSMMTSSPVSGQSHQHQTTQSSSSAAGSVQQLQQHRPGLASLLSPHWVNTFCDAFSFGGGWSSSGWRTNRLQELTGEQLLQVVRLVEGASRQPTRGSGLDCGGVVPAYFLAAVAAATASLIHGRSRGTDDSNGSPAAGANGAGTAGTGSGATGVPAQPLAGTAAAAAAAPTPQDPLVVLELLELLVLGSGDGSGGGGDGGLSCPPMLSTGLAEAVAASQLVPVLAALSLKQLPPRRRYGVWGTESERLEWHRRGLA